MGKEIFSKTFLAQYLKDFRLQSETDIFRKKEIIDTWIATLKSKRINAVKEEETKSRFILEIFGDVLGFNYRNPSNWLIREELKADVDATKPDAALGIFHINETGITNDVHVVIELKDANTPLDKPQNRRAFNISPVSQAFLYASKMGGNCKWVIVSNFTEIRFYHYSGQDECQVYNLVDLNKEEVLKEFLFLFHKDRLTHNEKSATEKLYELRTKRVQRNQSEKHIIDQLYDAIYKFEGFGFVDPNFLCNVAPFTTLEDHVWHYEKDRLLILNPLVSQLFANLTVENEKIVIGEKLRNDSGFKKVVEAQEKIDYIFQRLHNCMVKEVCAPVDIIELKKRAIGSIGFSLRHFHHIRDSELIILPTSSGQVSKCECVNCLLRNFDFIHFIKKLKEAEQNNSMDLLELAYGNYLLSTDNYRKAYFQYKNTDINTKGREDKKIHYFISKINQIYLFNLVSTGENDPQEKEILNDIKSIDLDRSIHNEMDMYVDSDVRGYLIEVKENKIFIKIKEFVTIELEKLEKSQGNNGDIHEIDRKYRFLYSHFHNNRIVYDAFYEFTQLVTKVFKSLVICHCSPQRRLLTFPEFYLTEAVLYVSPNDLRNILNDKTIEIEDTTQAILVNKAKNLLSSFAKEGLMGFDMAEPLLASQLSNYRFQENFTDIFSNTFTILSKVKISKDIAELLVKPIISFIKTENILSWTDIKELGLFIEKHGYIFKTYQYEDLFNHAVKNSSYGEHKYHSLILSLCKAHREFYPGKVLDDKSLIQRAISNTMDSNGRAHPKHLIYFYHIIDANDQHKLLEELNLYLSNEFDYFLLIEMLGFGIVKLDDVYLPMYLKAANQSKRQGYVGIVDGQVQFNDLTMINFIYQLYAYDVVLDEEYLSMFDNLCPFDAWAINPRGFDYTHFDANWLVAVDRDYILEKISDIGEIKVALEKRLRAEYDPTLSKIYFKYF